MKKFLLIVAAAIIAGVAYYAGTQNRGVHMNSDVDPRIVSASDMLLGTWSSEDDRNFEREYKADGVMIDSYASASGEVLSEAGWSLFTADNAPEVAFQLNNSDVYVEQVEQDGAKMYFRIINITPSALELMNMDRGNALRFGKMTGTEMRDGDDMQLSGSFRCDNDSSFVATFTADMEKVTIESEGETNFFPRVASANGQKYENASWSFFFRGEEAVVTDLKSNKSTTCNPPFDDENAPLNFGD